MDIGKTRSPFMGSFCNLTSRIFLVFLTLVFVKDYYLCSCLSTSDINSAILNTVISDFSSNGSFTFEDLEQFLSKGDSEILQPLNSTHELEKCLLAHKNNPSSDDCVVDCESLLQVYETYKSSSTDSSLNTSSLQTLSPVLLYLVRYNCFSPSPQGGHDHRGGHDRRHGEHHNLPPPTAASIWGYGFLMVTLINLCSLVGIVVMPFMKLAAYKEILVFMVALAVGALAGSGLLFLIPEAFGLVSEDEDDIMYIFKASTIMGGIYLFYITEKIMRVITKWKERRNMKRRNISDNGSDVDDRVMNIVCSVKKNMPLNQERMYKGASTFPNNTLSTVSTEQELIDKSSDESDYTADRQLANDPDMSVAMYEENGSEDKKEGSDQEVTVIKPLAWMIIFGDGLHNFIDGLSIGTAFTQSTLAGISVSVAVMCEELPHELGDFAILLNCGMTVRKALLYNFLSACMCYFGLIIGTLLGANTTSHDWVFAIAGGMFLYISLADMVPEMNSASEAIGGHRAKMIFFLQNLGLLVGFGVMLLLAIYGRYITFE